MQHSNFFNHRTRKAFMFDFGFLPLHFHIRRYLRWRRNSIRILKAQFTRKISTLLCLSMHTTCHVKIESSHAKVQLPFRKNINDLIKIRPARRNAPFDTNSGRNQKDIDAFSRTPADFRTKPLSISVETFVKTCHSGTRLLREGTSRNFAVRLRQYEADVFYAPLSKRVSSSVEQWTNFRRHLPPRKKDRFNKIVSCPFLYYRSAHCSSADCPWMQSRESCIYFFELMR